MTTDSRIHVHSMARVDVHTGVAYAEFRAAFEKAAPPFDREALIAATEGLKSNGSAQQQQTESDGQGPPA